MRRARVTVAAVPPPGRSLLGLALGLLFAGAALAQDLPPLELEAPLVPAGYEASAVVGSSLADAEAVADVVGCDSCGDSSCGGCEVPGYACPPGLGLWLRADYLMVWEKDAHVLPLVTTSTGIPADPADLLTLDAAETRVIFGDEAFNDNALDGWRLELGSWLDATATRGVMARYLDAGTREIDFSASSAQFGFLGVPFLDDASGQEEAFNIGVPNELTGSVNVQLRGDVEGFEVLFRKIAQTGCNYRLDWLYGYRNFKLQESLHLSANNLDTGSGLNPLGTTIAFEDQFDVENQFHGFDIGFTGHSHEGMWSLDFLVKVALGSMNQEINVNGSQTTTVPPNFTFGNIGGLFSQETNIGRHDQSDFAVIPEINVNIGYALTSNIDFTFGYTWIFTGDVVRAGTALDRTVHSGLFGDLAVNSNRPQVSFDEVSYWMQALNFGITGRF